jgi:hypothetical protein
MRLENPLSAKLHQRVARVKREAAFELSPDGRGKEVLEFADRMEPSSRLLETRVFGRDRSVRGLLRVTALTLATHL